LFKNYVFLLKKKNHKQGSWTKGLKTSEGVMYSVMDLHHVDADPDADPDFDFLFDADPDPTFHPDVDPDPSFKKGSNP
jgi:hypothetical protein